MASHADIVGLLDALHWLPKRERRIQTLSDTRDKGNFAIKNLKWGVGDWVSCLTNLFPLRESLFIIFLHS